jgi:hypothetical protein
MISPFDCNTKLYFVFHGLKRVSLLIILFVGDSEEHLLLKRDTNGSEKFLQFYGTESSGTLSKELQQIITWNSQIFCLIFLLSITTV